MDWLNMAINEHIWCLQKVSNATLVGSHSRKNSRAKERRTAQELLLQVINKKHPDWLDGTANSISKLQCEKLLIVVEGSKSSDSQYKFMHNFLCDSLLRGNKLGVWEAVPPPPMQTFINERAHRKEASFRQINVFRKIQNAFQDELRLGRLNRDRINQDRGQLINQSDKYEAELEKAINPEDSIRLLIEYAVLFGGLYVLSELKSFLKAIHEAQPSSDGVNVWLDIYIDKTSGSVTKNPVRADAKLRRWYLDIPMMCLLQQFHELQKNVQPTIKVEEVLLSRFKGSPFKSITAILDTAALVWELDNPATPGFLSSVSKDVLTSHPLPAHVLEKLYRPCKKTKLIRTKISSHSFNDPYDKSGASTTFFNYQQDKKLLIELLDIFEPRLYKLSHAEAIASIRARFDEPEKLSPLTQVIVSWALHLLKEGTRFKKKLALSTVKTYLSKVGTCWLRYSNVDLRLNMDGLEWEHFYHQISSSSKGKKSLSNLMGRLEEFHWYLSQTWHAEPLPESVFRVNRKNTSVVRANYINESEYGVTFRFIEEATASLPEQLLLLSVLILAYRCGLRKGEIVKLKLNDFDISKERLLRVRSNEFGNNKSESAYRIIPLHLLLRKEEWETVEQYLSKRKELLLNKTNGLAFVLPQTDNSKLTSDYIDDKITQAIKGICQDESVNFHTLRHSFVNNLYISLFIEPDKWPFAEHNYPRVRVKLFDLAGEAHEESGKALFAIASVAGHASPEETLLSYCHFTDVHLRICSNQLRFQDSELISRLLGMKQGSYTRFYQRNKNNLETALSKKLVREWPSEKLVGIAKVKQPKASGARALQHKRDFVADPILIADILNAFDTGHSIDQISQLTGQPLEDISRVVSLATELATLKSAKGYSRLISRTRTAKSLDESGEPKQLIAPQLPRESVLKADALKIVQRGFKALDGTGKMNLKKALDYYVKNVVASKPGVVIDTPKSAVLMINLLKELAGPSRLYVHHQAVSTNKHRRVNQFLKEKGVVSSNTSENQYSGKPFLCVNHPKQPSGQYKHSASVHYALHLLTIMSYMYRSNAST